LPNRQLFQMKTSNKILLSLFLLCVFIVVGIHVALYAKIKAGDFVSNEEIFKRTQFHQELPPTIKAVSITGLANCNLKTGSPAVSYHKESNANVHIVIRNDTLYLAANDWAKKEDYEQGTRNYQIVDVRIPDNLPVYCEYGSLHLSGPANPQNAPSFNINMRRKSELKTIDWEPKAFVYFNKLQVVSDESTIALSSLVVVNEMDVQATNSFLNYQRAEIKQHNVLMDDKSTIQGTQKSLGNINFIQKQ
jgi:hypothetical protein